MAKHHGDTVPLASGGLSAEGLSDASVAEGSAESARGQGRSEGTSKPNPSKRAKKGGFFKGNRNDGNLLPFLKK